MTVRLFTVPHTGTNFVIKFFEAANSPLKVQKDSRRHAPRINPESLDKSPTHAKAVRNAKAAPSLIVTARDPYLSAIRWIKPPSRSVFEMSFAWGHFFDVLESRNGNYFIIDIGCREADRVQHLCDAAEYIGADYDINELTQFAKDWKPENSSDTGAKKDYLANGQLPDPRYGTWDMLDEAVAWYANLKTNDK